jgi:predicted double-glycine peptidase
VFLKTFIFVAHGNILSLYDILKEKFTNHINFDDKISQVFRSLTKEHDDNEVIEKQEFNICVLLENGRLLFLTRRNGKDGEDVYLEDPKMEQDVQGKIIQFDQDRDDNAWTFILVQIANGNFAL